MRKYGLRLFLVGGLLLLLAACTEQVELGGSEGLDPGITPQVVPAQVFELEGNAVDNPAGGLDDWENVFDGTDSSIISIFIAEGDDDGSYFGTSAKDEINVTDWNWTANDIAPDKDEIMDAYVAAYTYTGANQPAGCNPAAPRGPSDPIGVGQGCGYITGDLIIVFGADRFAVNGDAQVGFWFFQDEVSRDTTDPTGGDFLGQTTVGDILIIADFLNGGGFASLSAFQWDGVTPLVSIATGLECSPLLGPANVLCAINNPDGTETSPWPYTPKQGTAGTFPVNAFFEGGVNFGRLFDEIDVGCFATFLAETRSSQSITAELKDFALGAFELCEITVTKTGDTLSKIGDEVAYEVVISNPGVITLYKQSIIDDVVGDLTDGTHASIIGSDCGDFLDPGDSCTITYNYTVMEGDPDPLVNTVTVTYNSDAGLAGDEVTAEDSHEVELFQPEVTITKTGDELSKSGDEVTYTFEINNTSSADTPDLNIVSIVDTVLGDLAAEASAAGCDTLQSDGGGADSCTFQVEYTIDGLDPDPLGNTVEVHYTPDPFENDVMDDDSHEVNLFQPSIELDKSGPDLAKVGDEITYSFLLTDTSSIDTPDLENCVLNDPTLGIVNEPITPGVQLDVNYTIPISNNPELVNTATATCGIVGFDNVLMAEGSHTVNLFVANILLFKSGPDLAKVGDEITYTFTLVNDSSANTPDLTCVLDDPTLGIVDEPITPGIQLDVPYVIPDDADDPLVNTATATCSIAGFENEVDASDGHTVELFQPSVEVIKGGPDLSKVGDTVTYEFTINNTSSADTPTLSLVSVDDTLLGDLTANALAAGCDGLNPGENCFFTVDYVVPDPPPGDPIDNTVTVDYVPDGFTNDVDASDSHSVNLFQPSIELTKSGPETAKVGDEITYTFLLGNDSSPDTPALTCTLDDPILGIADLPITPGVLLEFDYVIPGDADDPLDNEAIATCTIEGFDNVLEAAGSHSVDLFGPTVEVDKSGPEIVKVGDEFFYQFEITNTTADVSPDLILVSVMDDVLGDLTAVASANGCDTLSQFQSCSFQVPWTTAAGDDQTNTVTVLYNPEGFPNEVTDFDSHTVLLFDPSIELDKSGPDLAKVGDEIFYSFLLTNTSSVNTPDLTCVLNDPTLLIVNAPITPGVPLNVPYVIPDDADDPLVNTATATCSIDGFENEVEASDGHTVELFQPDVEIIKGGPDLSKVGDTVTYTFEINNTSSADSPDLNIVSISDTVLDDGDLATAASAAGCDTLAPGTGCNFSVDYIVPDPPPGDPIDNTVTVDYVPDGFTNDVDASDSHSVNLFQPAISLDKSGPEFSKVGDTITYTFLLTDDSSGDTPPLVDCVLNDPTLLIADLPITPGVPLDVDYVVPDGADDPLDNTATATCGIEGFDNEIEATDSHTVDLVAPEFDVTLTCLTDPVSQDGPATFRATFFNTGDVDLEVSASDGIGGFTLLAGTSQSFDFDVPGPFGGQPTVDETVNATWTLPAQFDLPNTADDSADATCIVASRVELLKTTDGVVDPSFDWQFAIYNGPDGYNSGALATDSSFGDADGVLDFGGFDFDPDPANVYTICELNTEATAGWTQVWTLNGVLIIPYNPEADSVPPEDNGVRCYDFSFSTGGETLEFTVDNIRPPGGDARTPGYWKNWSSCSNGNQYVKATSGDPADEFTALDELLVLNDPDFVLGLLDLRDVGGTNPPGAATCEDAVNILDHRSIDDGRNRANDAAYKLARNLLAYELNIAAGAAPNATAAAAAAEGHQLLLDISFDGTGRYLRPRDALYSDAIDLAEILDLYNNNLLP